MTHTGSKLEIAGDASGLEVNLTPVVGEAKSYKVTGVDRMSIEAMPPIDQKTYSLDDGRKVVIEFQAGEVTGTGYFIRLTGEASPKFKSCVLVN